LRSEEALPSAVIGAPGTSIESFPFGFVRHSFGILFLLVLTFGGLVVVIGTTAPFPILLGIRVVQDFPFGVRVVGRPQLPGGRVNSAGGSGSMVKM